MSETTAELRTRIEAQRSALGRDLDELGGRLSPKQVARRGKAQLQATAFVVKGAASGAVTGAKEGFQAPAEATAIEPVEATGSGKNALANVATGAKDAAKGVAAGAKEAATGVAQSVKAEAKVRTGRAPGEPLVDSSEAARAAAAGVAGRAKDAVNETTDRLKATAVGFAEGAKTAITRAHGGEGGEAETDDASGGGIAEQLRRRTESRPLVAGLLALGGGVVAAVLAPETDAERRAVRRAQPAIEDAAGEAGATAREVADDLGPKVADAATEVRDTAADAVATVKDEAAEAISATGDEMADAGHTVAAAAGDAATATTAQAKESAETVKTEVAEAKDTALADA